MECYSVSMKKQTLRLTSVLCVSVFASPASGAPTNCFSSKSDACEDEAARPLPASVDEYLKLRDEIGKTPRGGAALFLYALMVRTTDKALGDQLVVLSLAKDRLFKMKSGGTYKGYSLGGASKHLFDEIDSHAYCIRAHAADSSPENDYKMDAKAVGLRFRNQTKYVGSIESGRYKVFSCSAGAATCRPITLTRNENGIWKVTEFSSIAVGCVKPKATTDAAQKDDL